MQEQPLTIVAPPDKRLRVNLRDLWDYRELLYFLIWRDIKVRYKQTIIGAGWALVQPIFTMMIFGLFFGVLAGIPSNGLPYAVFYYSALLPWTYFANALTSATTSLVENQRVITRIYFPRILLPLTSTLTGLVDFGMAFIILIGMMFFYRIAPTPALMLLPLFLLLALVTALAVGLWLSALNAVYRDVRYVVPFVVQSWLFASPVAYPSSLVPERWRWLYGLNPMAGVIEGFRWALTGHGQPPGTLLFVSVGAVLIIFVGGLFYFQRMEETIADIV